MATFSFAAEKLLTKTVNGEAVKNSNKTVLTLLIMHLSLHHAHSLLCVSHNSKL